MAVKKNISHKNRWRPMRVKILGKWLWGMCKMAKKKTKGRHGSFRHVRFIESRAYRKFVIRRFQREGYFPIGCPSFKFGSPE